MTLPDKIRADFPILTQKVNGKPLIYFDSAATTQKPQAVIDAIINFYSFEYGTVHRGIYSLAAKATKKYNAAREKVAQFLNAKTPDEIVFTSGTTASINLIAHNYRGQEVILSEMEHHSNIVPWQMVGAKIKYIPVNDAAELDLDALEKLLTKETKLVAINHVANSTGTLNPIETIIAMAHARGAHVLLDAAQSIAHIPIDVQALDVDYLAFSGHKAYGPTGVGVLYGKYELLQALNPIQGGGDMIEEVTLEKTTFEKAPLKFEAGTPPIAQVIALGAAIDYINSLGLENIQSWEHELLLYATEKLTQIPGLKIIGTARNKTGIISFIIEGIHHLDLATFLDLEGIAVRSGHHCAQPLLKRFNLTGTNRISFAPFNTFKEIDTLIDALLKAKKILSPE